MLNILKKKQTLPKIKRVIPTDDWKLIFEFEESVFKILNYESLGDKFSILDSLSKASAYRTFALDKPSSYPRIALLMF